MSFALKLGKQMRRGSIWEKTFPVREKEERNKGWRGGGTNERLENNVNGGKAGTTKPQYPNKIDFQHLYIHFILI